MIARVLAENKQAYILTFFFSTPPCCTARVIHLARLLSLPLKLDPAPLVLPLFLQESNGYWCEFLALESSSCWSNPLIFDNVHSCFGYYGNSWVSKWWYFCFFWQTLYTYPDNFRAYKILIAAEYSGAKITLPPFKLGETNQTAEFLKKFPLGKVFVRPLLNLLNKLIRKKNVH